MPEQRSRGPRRVPSYAEFIVFLALCQAMAAIAIDLLLPAFPQIRAHTGLPEGSTKVSLLITAFFLGSGLSQLMTGILSDRFGRRPVLFAGFTLYVLGAVTTAFSPTLGFMIASRFLWGVGQSAPRTVSSAIVRDKFEGTRMAQTMSYMQSVFVIIPIVAPSIGKYIVEHLGWRAAVMAPAFLAIVLAAWLMRIPETLSVEMRRSISARKVLEALREVVRVRRTVLLAIAITLMLALVNMYISLAEVIFDKTYGKRDLFPILFGAVAAVMGIAALTNARTIHRVGIERMLRSTPFVHLTVATLFVVWTFRNNGVAPMWVFCGVVAALLMVQTVTIPNANSIALQPFAHIAGLAAGLIGTFSTVMGALLSTFVFRRHTTGTKAISVGFVLCSIGVFVMVGLAMRVRWRSPRVAAPAE